jgi:predicted regulator of Ras-like GTPase activity (Roadblock/LC7/MglB family)
VSSVSGPADLILLEDDEARLTAVLEALVKEAKAVAAFLLDRGGRLLAGAGETEEIDTTALASLVSGSMAATGSLARLVGEEEFGALILEGEQVHLYIGMAEPGLILAILFDHHSTAGLVRFRARRTALDVAQVFADSTRRGSEGSAGAAELAEITDDEIDNLLSN